MTDLERLEANHIESEAAVHALMAQWKEEDVAVARDRAVAMERIENGRRDRDEMRVKLGGTSLIEAKSPPPEPDRPRASSLPVTPIAALGQTKA